jgi:hypothetical protein
MTIPSAELKLAAGHPNLADNDLGNFALTGKKTRAGRAKVPPNAKVPR